MTESVCGTANFWADDQARRGFLMRAARARPTAFRRAAVRAVVDRMWWVEGGHVRVSGALGLWVEGAEDADERIKLEQLHAITLAAALTLPDCPDDRLGDIADHAFACLLEAADERPHEAQMQRESFSRWLCHEVTTKAKRGRRGQG